MSTFDIGAPVLRHIGSLLGNVSTTFVSCLPSLSAQRDVAFVPQIT
jgi:hypothetical protein